MAGALTEDSFDASSLLADYPLVIEIMVLWGDEDSFNHVNNVSYLRWCETARIEYFRRIGLFTEGPPQGLGPILASVTCHYQRPLRYPDTVLVGSRVTAIGNSSFRMEHRIVSRALREVAAEADSAMVTVDYATGKSQRVPDDVREAIAQLEKSRGADLSNAGSGR